MFAPLDRNDKVCGECHFGSLNQGVCAWCSEETDLVMSEIAICHVCARKPKYRKKFWQAVKDKIESDWQPEETYAQAQAKARPPEEPLPPL